MQDFFGSKLEVGDEVAITPHGYKHLVLGTVVTFTPKMVKVSYMQEDYRYGGCPVRSPVMILRNPTEVVKKPVVA